MSVTIQNINKAVLLCENSPWDGRIRGQDYLSFFLDKSSYLDRLHDVLGDRESRETLEWMVRYRIARMYFPTERASELIPGPISLERWRHLTQIASEMKPQVHNDYVMDRIETWLLNGYEIKNIFEYKPSDVVIDGGAYTGNTSVYFSEKVGEAGLVLAFEPSLEVHKKLSRNVAQYKNIKTLQIALSNREGRSNLKDIGPGSYVDPNGNEAISTDTIDNLLRKFWIKKVDVIKLDVEGEEEKCILGAKNTIKKCKPKLAICIYHKVDDLFRIPRTLLAINPNYSFYIRHNSYCEHETVIFCVPCSIALDIAFTNDQCILPQELTKTLQTSAMHQSLSGDLQYKEGNIETALKFYNNALEINTSSPYIAEKKFYALMSLKKNEEAINFLWSTAISMPNALNINILLIKMLLFLKKGEKALEIIKSININDPSQTWYVRYLEAKAYFELGNIDSSATSLRLSIDASKELTDMQAELLQNIKKRRGSA
jgi:FkbM family methyltransferase